MKKQIIFATAAMLLSLASYAQSGIGIKAGPNFASVRASSGGKTETTKMQAGMQIGVYAEFKLGNDLFIQPGLMYESKGGKIKNSDSKYRLNYLTLPVDLVFKPEVGSGRLVLGAGPYLGYALSGKLKGVKDVSDVNLFKGDNKMKRFDAGAHFQVGYELKSGLTLGLNAELGLLNLSKADGGKFRNTSFGVTVGYTLHR